MREFEVGDEVIMLKDDYFEKGEKVTIIKVDNDDNNQPYLATNTKSDEYWIHRDSIKLIDINGIKLLQLIKKGEVKNCDIKVYKENKYKFTIQCGEKAILDNPNFHVGMLTSDKYTYEPVIKKEMTISEIEKQLGYSIKIVKE